ncbi:MAG: Hsp20/alpha crystallin family protein [Ectothiorhodospiraceae bacterium]|nr:Hsp20/alpha crystallin family protein [Chromatiales bacterium]MCP5153753.1 Hsp20/alpha crystallin family protein [Ectothiorhodospiraceae bacterium]
MSSSRDDPLRRWPFDDMERVLRGFGSAGVGRDEESNVVTSHWMPPVDIREEAAGFVIEADVPGVDPAAIEVSMADGVLSIRGERPAPGDAERTTMRRAERARGTFYRRFSLPDTADAQRITARCTSGVLRVDIPKRAAATPRKIEVRG